MKKPHISLISAVLLLLAAATGTQAQNFPAKPIALIMPFAAGGPGDTMARHLGAAMSAPLKQQIVVENPSGARRRHDRHQPGGEVQARRLHAAHHEHRHVHGADALP
jgi:tripartite-type tricarboxylate transporter receptor subunit TctC